MFLAEMGTTARLQTSMASMPYKTRVRWIFFILTSACNYTLVIYNFVDRILKTRSNVCVNS